MNRFFQRIINTGIGSHTPPEQVRNIKTTNLFAVIALFSFMIGFSNVLILESNFAFIPVTILFLFNFLTFFLNHAGKYLFATYVFLININLIQFFVMNYYVIESGGYLYYFPISLCVVLIYYDPKRIVHTLLQFGIMVFFVGLRLLLEKPLFLNQAISEEQVREIFYFNLFLSIVLNVILIFLVVRVITRQNKRLIFLLEKQEAREEKIKQSLKEKEVLLAEVHHRVKNNLSIVSSLLNLQINISDNAQVQQTLTDSRNRVMSMSKVHEKLYQRKNFNFIAFDDYIKDLALEINITLARQKEIEMLYELSPVNIGLEKAIPVGLIINETITNSIKHAFKQTQDNHIFIKLSEENNRVTLAIHDNGCGFPKGFNDKSDSLGMVLIHSLVDQVDGKIDFENRSGALTTVVFSKN